VLLYHAIAPRLLVPLRLDVPVSVCYQARNAAGMRAFQHLVCKSTAKTAKKINNNN